MAVEAEFLISAASPSQFPRDAREEAVFIGRSNVGKSSLINKLTGQRNLAFTSSRPGCTRTINFFNVGRDLRLVDLPGYGFAAGPVEDKRAWKALIDAYLETRSELRWAVVLIDARRGWMDPDRLIRDWLQERSRNLIVAATKIDKLNRKELDRGLAAIRAEAPGEVIAVSAEDGRGVRELWQAISKAPAPTDQTSR
jgi:GTP-binding protein